MNAARFNRQINRGRLNAERNLSALERGYRIALQTEGHRVADRFEELATDHLTADATDPKWTPPQTDELIDDAALIADAKKRTAAAHKAAVKAVVAPVVSDIGVAYDVSNPLISGLLEGLGVRAQDLGDAIRAQVADAVLAGYQGGLSVPDTAAKIREAADEISPVRAAMLARTDLVGLANGASVAAARLVNGESDSGEPLVGYKQWLATADERTRETHGDADGQVVPIDQPFDVGSEQADFPGSPDLSDEEAANCRCTVVFLEAAEALAESGDLQLAASGASPTDAVRSRGHMAESPDDTLTADVTITVGEEQAAAGTAPVSWQAVLCVEGEPTEDGRMLETGSITWRDLPLSLGAMFETPHSYDSSAEICGRIDRIWRDGNLIMGAGVFGQDEVGQRAAGMVADLTLRGISVDLAVVAYEIREADPPVATDETDDSPDAGSDIADVITEIDNLLMVVTEGVIGAATVCPFQAIAQATIQVVADAAESETISFAQPTCFVLTRTERGAVTAAAAPDLTEMAARIEDLATQIGDGERARADDNRTMQALIAAAVDETTIPRKLLTDIGQTLASLSEEIGRKPRTVKFERDTEGKMTGLRAD